MLKFFKLPTSSRISTIKSKIIKQVSPVLAGILVALYLQGIMDLYRRVREGDPQKIGGFEPAHGPVYLMNFFVY